MSPFILRALQTVGLLIVSNTFMTIAWYGHLKGKPAPLIVAILLSWGIASLEYVFQVPANRIGAAQFSLTQLKVIQEAVALTVFLVYAAVAFKETPKWNTIVAFVLILAAVGFAFAEQKATPASEEGTAPVPTG